MKRYEQFYIGGEWVTPAGTATEDVVNPATEEIIGSVPMGTPEDVARAVAAARQAFPSWSTTSVDVRAKYLRDIGAALTARYDELVDTISAEVGSPKAFAQMVQAGLAVGDWNTYADQIEAFEWEKELGNSLVVREPIGVVAAITPWNYPLYLIVCKVAPALAAGCTVVLFNMVIGNGPDVGGAMTAPPDVDMVSFTGSGRAGKEVSKSAADTVKRVELELGGKSANIVLDDADPATVAFGSVFACMLNSGQTCSALTRLLVPADMHDEIVDAVVAEVAQAKLVDPTADEPDLFHAFGPLVSAAQRDRVRDYIQKGIDEGADLVIGGPEQPEDQPRGFYVKPTVFANVDPDSTIAQEEIFGPVLAVIPYTDEDDAIRIANNTIYGLAGGVQSADVERAKSVARRMRTGQVDINGGGFNAAAPFGGYGQSGNGRERGEWGIDGYLETKSIQL